MSIPVTTIEDPLQVERFIRHAAPGEWFRYHTGFLANDRRDAWKRGSPTHDIAGRIWSLWERGLVHLVQRKLGPGIWEYLAIRKPAPPREKPIPVPKRMAVSAPGHAWGA